MSEHTPGPWRAVIDIPGYNQSYRVEAADGSICVPCYGRTPRGIDEVNARLIAAAPELLDLLRESQDYIGGDWRTRRDVLLAHIDGTGVKP